MSENNDIPTWLAVLIIVLLVVILVMAVLTTDVVKP
jgi:hypothetical protein